MTAEVEAVARWQPDGSYIVPDGPFGPGYTVPKSTFDQWRAQGAVIRAELQVAIDRDKAAKLAAAELETEKQAALAWCRANGSPHLEPKP